MKIYILMSKCIVIPSKRKRERKRERNRDVNVTYLALRNADDWHHNSPRDDLRARGRGQATLVPEKAEVLSVRFINAGLAGCQAQQRVGKITEIDVFKRLKLSWKPVNKCPLWCKKLSNHYVYIANN